MYDFRFCNLYAMNKKSIYVLTLIILILAADQALKFWIKTHLIIGEQIPVFGNWFKLCFVENEGMAYGLSFGGAIGKYALSIFRIIASIALVFWLRRLIRENASWIAITAISLVFVGAVGNLIDCVFYGKWFTESFSQVATFLPPQGGYAPYLQGKVVDMLYFPLYNGIFPQWLPGLGGTDFQFFSYIFNIADSSISLGAVCMFFKQKEIFK